MRVNLNGNILMVTRNRPVGDPNRVGYGRRKLVGPAGTAHVFFLGAVCVLVITH